MSRHDFKPTHIVLAVVMTLPVAGLAAHGVEHDEPKPAKVRTERPAPVAPSPKPTAPTRFV